MKTESGIARRAALVLLVVACAGMSGCCTFKRMFGSLDYAVQVRRGGPEVEGQSTAVLLVWPGSEEVAEEFRELTQFHEAVQLARNLENKGPENGAFAHLGSFNPGAGDCSRAADRDGRALVRHCTATNVLIFTSKTQGPREKSIAHGDDPFKGFIQIDLTPDDGIEIDFVTSIPAPSSE